MIIINDIITYFKVFFKKKPIEWRGFKIGDRIEYKLFYEHYNKGKITKFIYSYDKFVLGMEVDNQNRVFFAQLEYMSKQKATRSNLPKWW